LVLRFHHWWLALHPCTRNHILYGRFDRLVFVMI
jgi:hypothetical protein